MPLWSRIANVFRGERTLADIDDEFEAHIAEAIEAGRDADEARRAFGSALHRREESRDVRVVQWLDALRADAVFGWRQLRKNRVAAAVAVLSLGLAIGASASAFRLIDALLFRALPIAAPEQLAILMRTTVAADGVPQESDAFEYPLFRRLRAVARPGAELIAVSYPARVDVSYPADAQLEKAWRQYVSGSMFASFGLRPASGRLLTESDDLYWRARPYAVLAYDYWRRRFAADPNVVGRTLAIGSDLFTIVGVVEEGFTGTDPGTMTDIFVPTMMHPGVNRADWSWFRIWVRVTPDAAAAVALQRQLGAASRAFREETARSFRGRPQRAVDRFVDETVTLQAAAAGVSALQKEYDRSLAALGVLVAFVLIIACANVANLMTAQAAARADEMALRASIGAGRARLVQLALVQSAWLALLAAVVGGGFTWWAAPFVVSLLNPADNPVRLPLPADGRVFGFGVALTIAVTFVCGLAPALRAASSDARLTAAGAGSARLKPSCSMRALIALQVGFCVLIVFVAALFVATFNRLSHVPTGFSAERLLLVETIARRASPARWNAVAEHLRALPGVDSVAIAGWPLLSGNVWATFVSTGGAPPSDRRPYFLNVSPGWMNAMGIPFVAGRDFTAKDVYPGMAIVNESFAKEYFDGKNPIGQWFEETPSRGDALPSEAAGIRFRVQIVGVVRDARYRDMREPMRPTAYVPFQSRDAAGALEPIGWGTLVVRTAADRPDALASTLRREVQRIAPEFRVATVRTQLELNRAHTVRERLLAALALFFAAVAVLLAAGGVYGVLHYSVLQRRREIGIRIALGSRAVGIARCVAAEPLAMTIAGAAGGLIAGFALRRYIDPLIFGVSAADPVLVAVPLLTICVGAALAALPPVLHALRIDPVTMLRAE